jgi:hypothetical protein
MQHTGNKIVKQTLETSYRMRQSNEIQIKHDLDLVNQLRNSLRESNSQTQKMTNILNSFETQLTTMHDLIMPLHEATKTLQIKHSNIQKTSARLEDVIEYYDSVQKLSQVIEAGYQNI